MEPQISATTKTATPSTASIASIPTTSARTAARPKSACCGTTKQRTLRLPTEEHRVDDTQTVSAAGRANGRVCTKPRPPSASAALTSSTLRRPRPQSHAPLAKSSNQLGHSGATTIDVGAIPPRIMREEIETQRRVTRRAQREYSTQRVQLTAKQQEIKLLERHLRAFDVESFPSPHKSVSTAVSPRGRPLTSTEQLKDEIRRLDAYKKTLRHMLDRLARHLHFLRANTELLESQRVAAAREAALFEDKVVQERSLCAELEFQRAQLATERSEHRQHSQQLLASLRSEIQSRALLSQQRHEADHRREEMLRLVESRPKDSTTSISISSLVATATATGSADHPPARPLFPGPPPLQKRGSQGRHDSLQLLMEESLQFFGAGSLAESMDGNRPGITPSSAALAVAVSSRRLQMLRSHTAATAATLVSENQPVVMHRETFYEVYETQYERILEQTGESDLAIVLERFHGFREAIQRLHQIEKDLVREDSGLETKKSVLQEQLQELRQSGIAEVEKRKKIRDFLEQQLHVKKSQRVQAEDIFVDRLRTFSYVQQGILNITELLKCLEEKFSPPVLPASSTSATATIVPQNGSIVHRSVRTALATTEISWLQSLLYTCRSCVRGSSSVSAAIDFTADQIARLSAIDPMLGLARSDWAVQRLKHSIGGGTMVARAGRDGPPVINDGCGDSDHDHADDDDDDDDGLDDEVEDRARIKSLEQETLEQAELLLRTFDSRQQLAQHGQSMQRTRRLFGLNGGVVQDSEHEAAAASAAYPVSHSEMDHASRLAVVHAFFKEKRLRAKLERQEKRESRAALGGLTVASSSAAPSTNSTAKSAAAIMAEMRAGPGHRQQGSVETKTLPAGAKRQQKRTNGVTFSQPVAAIGPQQQGEASRRAVKTPTRPPTASTAAVSLTHRRVLSGTFPSPSPAGPSSQQQQLVLGRERQDPGVNLQPKLQ